MNYSKHHLHHINKQLSKSKQYIITIRNNDIIKVRVQNNLDDLAQDYLNEKYNQEALYEYNK